MITSTSLPSKLGMCNLRGSPDWELSVSTVVDLLEAKNISWASYQENLPQDGYFNYKYVWRKELFRSIPDLIL